MVLIADFHMRGRVMRSVGNSEGRARVMQPHPGAAMQRMVLTGAATVALWCHPAIADAQRNAAPTASATTQAAWDGTEVAGLRWRNVGPSRGGRSVAVVGVASKPLTYFAGYTGGGIWRTDDAGITWRNVSDGFLRTGSIGALAVAPSDENVIYAGSGEHAIRGQSSSYGDGVYKSTDMGSTWTHIGLSASRQIAAVRVHPANEDVVYVAVQGDRWKGSAERGVYRSRDGGATWTELTANRGLPKGVWGKVGLAVSPANSRRPPAGRVAAGARTVKQKLLPCPGPALSTPIVPPISSTNRLLIASPRPVPPYLRVVLLSAWLNFWNNRDRPSLLRPMPVSRKVRWSRLPTTMAAARW
jgi:hypothetical protein